MKEPKKYTVKERIIHYLKKSKITQSEFCKRVGLSSGYIGAMRKSFQPDTINKIVIEFPDLDITWLLTGEGEMLKNAVEVATSGHRIRYWVDVDATAGGVTQFDDMMSSQYIDLAIPEFRDCTDAVNLYGDSMFPLYKSGSIIILKEWKESFIDFGNVYLIITKNGNRMVKYLRKGSDVAHVLCVSDNKEFDPFEIEIGDILRLYLVKGGVHKNTL